jgi:hypothetical protein
VRVRPACLWARAFLQTTTWPEAHDLVQRIRFDLTTRCAVPFRLADLPTGMTVRGCDVRLGATPPPAAVLDQAVLTVGDGRRGLNVMVMDGSGMGDDYPGTLRAGPYKVLRQPDGEWDMLVKPWFVQSRSTNAAYPLSQSTALAILGGFRGVGDIQEPGTW